LADDGIHASDLVERLDIRPSSISETLRRVEELGFIVRKSDLSDSRAVRIEVTPEGRQAIERRKEEFSRQGSWISECLSKEELDSFSTICQKLCGYLESKAPQFCPPKRYGRHDWAGGHSHRDGRYEHDGHSHRQ
jgi:DNA-binding MarR family transcriptional regulator